MNLNLKYWSNTTIRHSFDTLVTGMSWPDDPVIVIQNVNFSTQKGNEKQPEQEALHDELKLRNPGVHISNLGARDQRSICQTGCLGAGQCFATQLRKINMLSWRFADVWTQMTIDTLLQLLLREIQLSLWWASKLLQLIETVCGLVKTLVFQPSSVTLQIFRRPTIFLIFVV